MSPFWNAKGELTPTGRKIALYLFYFYLVALGLMCFLPQPFRQVQTPGIQHYGRLVVLLTPFNSLVNLGQIDHFWQLLWVLGQNISNIFLLYPLILLLLFLKRGKSSFKKVSFLSFGLSLLIECSQLLLDLLFNANRVFEIDDLWTNTLGGMLAFFSYKWLQQKIRQSYDKSSPK